MRVLYEEITFPQTNSFNNNDKLGSWDVSSLAFIESNKYFSWCHRDGVNITFFINSSVSIFHSGHSDGLRNLLEVQIPVLTSQFDQSLVEPCPLIFLYVPQTIQRLSFTGNVEKTRGQRPLKNRQKYEIATHYK